MVVAAFTDGREPSLTGGERSLRPFSKDRYYRSASVFPSAGFTCGNCKKDTTCFLGRPQLVAIHLSGQHPLAHRHIRIHGVPDGDFQGW